MTAELFSEWECRRCGEKAKLNALAIQAFCSKTHKMFPVKLDKPDIDRYGSKRKEGVK